MPILGILPKLKKFFFSWFNFGPERPWVLLFFVILVLAFSARWRLNFLAKTELTPAFGGVYQEGLAASRAELDQIIEKLTKSSFFYFDAQKNLQPYLAKDYTVSADAKTFTVNLKDGVSLDETFAALEKRKDLFANIELKKTPPATIQFILRQSYGPFLATLTTPLFESGPFILEKEDAKQVVLAVNQNALNKPYLERLIFNLYPEKKSAQMALKQKEVMGFLGAEEKKGNQNLYELTLPFYQILFFNLAKPNLTLENRAKILEGNLPKEQSLEILTNLAEENIAKAQELKRDFEKTGANIKVKSAETKEVNERLKKGDFETALTWIDLGCENDPYPFWHSKEIGGEGRNFSSVKNIKIDQSLEELRKKNNLADQEKQWQEAKKILEQEKAAVFLGQRILSFAVDTKIKGISIGQGCNPASRFNEVWKWYIKEKREKKV